MNNSGTHIRSHDCLCYIRKMKIHGADIYFLAIK
jgi:hypothetical protein